MDVSVYFDRTGLKDAVLTLLIPPTESEPRPTVFATGTEINGEAENPASLHRVHRYVADRIEEQRPDDGDDEDLQDELAELLSADDGAIESADPDADRETAHQIIAALAAAYPLEPAVRNSLPLAP
ncbi:hypothetical protein ACIPJK_00855 [Streptomyces roseus]|uniref:hypothetical protein n=1 Tax=Streptomyces TaxID=1883 RepID=UPI00100E6F8D|nr:hypothetical protein [Streptomyces sp. M3]